jgi:hypothetical protein
MFTRLWLGCVLGLALVAYCPGASADGLFNRDSGLFGGDSGRGHENEGPHFAFFDSRDPHDHCAHKKHVPHCGCDLDECPVSKHKR